MTGSCFVMKRIGGIPKKLGLTVQIFYRFSQAVKNIFQGNFTIKYKIDSFNSTTKLDKKYIISKMNGNAT